MASRIKHGLELFGSAMLYGGILAAVYLSVTGKPRLHAEIAGSAVAVGVAMMITHSLAYGDEPNTEVENATQVVGVLAALVGIAMFPLGLFVHHVEYRLITVSGFFLLASGMVIIAIATNVNERKSGYQVPEDPTEILEEDQ